MSLEDLGNIGEFVGAFAVVLSLIYLAVQIRQNTEMLRASTHHGMTAAGTELNKLLAGNDAVAHIFFTGLHDARNLSPEERFRLDLLMRSTFAFYEDTYLQMRKNVLDTEAWESRRGRLGQFVNQPGAQWWWNRHSENYSKGFQEEVRKLIST